MYRFCQIVIAVLLLSVAGVGISLADDTGQSMDTLSAYLHGHQLPLVEARLITKENGERDLMLYGYVATEYGKADAEEQARDFVDDPDIEIINRIQVRPELLTLGRDSNTGAAADTDADADSADTPDASAAGAEQEAAQDQNFPDAIEDRDAYMNQGDDDDLLANNGLSGGIPFPLAIIGSGFVVPPFGVPIIAAPIYYNTLPPVVIRRPIYAPPPVIVMGHYNPPTVFRSPFTSVSPFPAGAAPMFPATGGAFPHTFNQGFGGFHSTFSGFHGGFGGGFGMHGGGFGGHR
jgi:hypothetical protein